MTGKGPASLSEVGAGLGPEMIRFPPLLFDGSMAEEIFLLRDPKEPLPLPASSRPSFPWGHRSKGCQLR